MYSILFVLFTSGVVLSGVETRSGSGWFGNRLDSRSGWVLQNLFIKIYSYCNKRENIFADVTEVLCKKHASAHQEALGGAQA